MINIEQTKSEQVAAQVQDANPGNFAIEQEVGAMVGATVPAPSEPSADDARELGAQLLVFLRRALLPIRSALRTALADIYDHLDSRCTAYTPAGYASYIPRPYDPMGLTPRTLPNLLTAITAFASRKISNGSAPNDGIPDGTSLAKLLCNTASANAVTEILDDNPAWDGWKQIVAFPNVKKLSVNCKTFNYTTIINGSQVEEIDLPEAITILEGNSSQGGLTFGTTNTKLVKVYAPKLNSYTGGYSKSVCDSLEEFIAPSCTYWNTTISYGGLRAPKLRRLVLGKLTYLNINEYPSVAINTYNNDLIDFEFGQGTDINLNLANWNPTNALSSSASDLVADPTAHPTWKNLDQFLQNFLEHICQKLANRTGQTKLTLTLSADVYTAIMTDNDIKAELVARNWKVTDGTNNFNN